MKREKLIQSVGKPFFKPLGILQGLLLLLFIASPFVWIWYSWSLAWRLALTGLLGLVVTYFIYLIVTKSVTEFVDAEMAKGKDSELNLIK